MGNYECQRQAYVCSRRLHRCFTWVLVFMLQIQWVHIEGSNEVCSVFHPVESNQVFTNSSHTRTHKWVIKLWVCRSTILLNCEHLCCISKATIKVEKADKSKHAGKGWMNSILRAWQRSRHFCFHLVLTGQAGVRNYSIFTAQRIVVWRDVIQSDATKINLANIRCRWSLKVYFCPWRWNPL